MNEHASKSSIIASVQPGGDGTGAPSPWVVAHVPSIRPGGRVLDLACGGGRHARYLAAAGFGVLAVDRDEVALQGLRGVPGIEARAADLEAAGWPLAGERFDAVVVTRYLFRPHLPQLVGALWPGGVLIYETFMRGQERYGRPSNPDFLLQPGELRDFSLAHGLEVVEFREGAVTAPKPAALQAICARRPG